MALKLLLVLTAVTIRASALSLVNKHVIVNMQNEVNRSRGPPGRIFYPAASTTKVAWNDRSLLPDENDSPVISSEGDYVPWSLCGVKYKSNLAGLGPDFGREQSLRYKNVGKAKDSTGRRVKFDLVVTVNSSYSAKDLDKNGLVSKDSCFGRINIATNSAVDLLFSFYETGTNMSIALDRFYFTVYDMDSSKENQVREASTFYNRVNDVFYAPDHEMEITGDLASGLTFLSTTYGTGHDNPTHPGRLTTRQKRHAVMVDFLGKTQWKITFATVGSGSGGRNFVFTGMGNLFPEPPTAAPTTTTMPRKKKTTTRFYYNKADNPTPLPTPAPTTTTTSCISQSCLVYADPHVAGFDNTDNQGPAYLALIEGDNAPGLDSRAHNFDRRPLDVDAYDTGDVWLVKSHSVHIQARFALSGEFVPDRAAVGAVAVGGPFTDGHTYIVEPLKGGVTVDNVQLPVGASTYADGAASVKIDNDSGEVSMDLPLGVQLRLCDKKIPPGRRMWKF